MNLLLGVAIAIFAGSINGLFALPMKVMKKWQWENIWFPFSILSFFIFPWIVAKMTIPHLGETLSSLCPCDITTAMIIGALAYTGSLMCSLAFDMIGQALTFALLVGAMTIVGVLFPILIYHPEIVPTKTGFFIILGVAMVFVSLILSVIAGMEKEKSQNPGAGGTKNKKFMIGIIFSIVGGSLSGLISLGMNMNWAISIKTAAVNFGQADASQATNAVVMLLLWGGGIPNIIYTVFKLTKNKNWNRFSDKDSKWYWLLLIMMCLQYSGSVILWGISSSENLLGKLGSSIGWALFVGMIVVSSNAGGFLTGEWKNSGKKAFGIMLTSLSIIILAMVAIGYGNFMLK
jgi:L-rhamnose-H+ transport protein